VVIVKQLLGFRRAETLDHRPILPRIAWYVQRGMTRAQTEEVPGQGKEAGLEIDRVPLPLKSFPIEAASRLAGRPADENI